MTAILDITTSPETPAPAADRPLAVRWPRKTTGRRPRRAGLSRRDVATRLAKRRLLAERLTALITADVALLKAEQRDGRQWMCPGDEETVYLGTERIGYVGMPETGYTLAITDLDAFFEWLTDEYPTEVVWQVELTSDQLIAFRAQGGVKAASQLPVTPSVRPAFWRLLTEGAKTGRTVHPGTGEFLDIPGLTVNPTNPSPTFNKASGVKHPRIAHAAHSGALSAAEVAALLDLPTPTAPIGGTP